MKPNPTPAPATCHWCDAPATVVVDGTAMCAGCRAMDREIADQKCEAVIQAIRALKRERPADEQEVA